MKKQHMRILIALFCVAVSGIAASGQAQKPMSLTVNHSFVLAGKTLPAGTYIVKRVDYSNPRALTFVGQHQHTSVLVMPIAGRGTYAQNITATFDEVDGQYVLRQVQSTSDGFMIIPDRSERAHVLTASASQSSGRD